MDKSTKALVQKVAALEKKVHAFELKISTPRKHEIESKEHENNASQECQTRTGTIPALTAPRNSSDFQNLSDNTTPRWSRVLAAIWKWPWRRILNIGGIIAGIGYAVVAFLQWRDLQRNFAAEQRAWIKPMVEFSATPYPGAVAHVKNIGKSPAFSVYTSIYLQVIKNKDAPIIPPDDMLFSLTEPIVWMGDTTIPTPVPLTRKDQTFIENEGDDLLQGRSFLIAFGQAIYKDAFGKHWTRFCLANGYNQRVTYFRRRCSEFNKTGEGDPPKNWYAP